MWAIRSPSLYNRWTEDLRDIDLDRRGFPRAEERLALLRKVLEDALSTVRALASEFGGSPTHEHLDLALKRYVTLVAEPMVDIRFRVEDATIVQDFAVGCAATELRPDRGSGRGLGSMRERIRLLGGTIMFETAPGHGGRVEMSVELPEGTV
jgi:signal transduction histidine kinase